MTSENVARDYSMKFGFIGRKCPRCGGNLYLDQEFYVEGLFINWYEQEICLQCGYSCTPAVPEVVAAAAIRDNVRPAIKQLVSR